MNTKIIVDLTFQNGESLGSLESVTLIKPLPIGHVPLGQIGELVREKILEKFPADWRFDVPVEIVFANIPEQIFVLAYLMVALTLVNASVSLRYLGEEHLEISMSQFLAEAIHWSHVMNHPSFMEPIAMIIQNKE